MVEYSQEFGVVGLGRMGGGLALQAVEKDIRVVGYDVRGVSEDMRKAGIVDGGNSYWGDSIRRACKLKEHGVRFIDLGTSGGIDGARHGACFMVGGEREAVARIRTDAAQACRDGRLCACRSFRGRPFHETGTQRYRVRHAPSDC